MAILTYLDIQEALNIDLTDPNGQAVVTDLIASAIDAVEQQVDYPLEESQVTEYFDGTATRLWLSTRAPVSSLTISTYNPSTQTYEALDSTQVRYQGRDVYISAALPTGFQSVRATYTTGWTAQTLPADLKHALIEMVGLKLQEVTNYASNPDDPDGDGQSVSPELKRVTAGGYSEEYASSGQTQALWQAKSAQLSRLIGSATPEGIEEVIARYRLPYAL